MAPASARSVASAASERFFVALFFVALLASPVSAQDELDPAEHLVSLSLVDCYGVSVETVTRIVRAELGADRLAEPRTEAWAEVELVCDDVPRLRLRDHITGKLSERSLDLRTITEPERARLVALAIVELVAASFAELELAHETGIPVVDAAGSDAAREEARSLVEERRVREAPETVEARRPLGVRIFGSGRLAGDPVHVAFGGGLGAELTPTPWLALLLDGRVDFSSVGVGALGAVRSTVATGAFGVGVHVPLGANVFVLGGCVRAGAAILEGQPVDGVGSTTLTGASVSVGLVTSISLHIGGNGYLFVGFDLAGALVGPSGVDGATGAVLFAERGANAALTIGFEVRPDLASP